MVGNNIITLHWRANTLMNLERFQKIYNLRIQEEVMIGGKGFGQPIKLLFSKLIRKLNIGETGLFSDKWPLGTTTRCIWNCICEQSEIKNIGQICRISGTGT